ncbi:hypothetical protein DUI87_18013 [Hirundo rustica rustica]|uniref:Uncharacterized protein n=1 Tax=Hirundo rustica rustica TaxID=333673 RepID=A0A3M0JVH7_HIRRU|nr:hypothetical protein DUI87_18013 [Hirundo rustica rustica]
MAAIAMTVPLLALRRLNTWLHHRGDEDNLSQKMCDSSSTVLATGGLTGNAGVSRKTAEPQNREDESYCGTENESPVDLSIHVCLSGPHPPALL